MIKINGLTKVFKIPKKQEDLSWIKKKLKWFYREWIDKVAVIDMSFDIKEGEIVGYIGPNGAGKSTTIKMLTGILTPTSGEANILGYHPNKDRIRYTKHIGVVFGQRSTLEYNIPVKDSYNIFRAIYDVPKDEFKKRLNFLIDTMEIRDLIETPYRKLSLGEKMRCELVAAFLHKPKIVFLDEPTIGLDVVAKHKIRDFLKDINKREKVTIILTTHDMGDIEELADRIILIDHGIKMYDGGLKQFKKKYSDWRVVEVIYEKKPTKFITYLKKNKFEFVDKNNSLNIQIPSNSDFKKFLETIVKDVDLKDLKIEDPLLENVVKKVYELNKESN